MVYSRDFTYGHQNQSDSHNQMLGKIEWIIFHYSENVLISASYSWFYGALWEWWKKKISNSLPYGDNMSMKCQRRI